MGFPAHGRLEEGKLRATRQVLRQWAQERKEAWQGAMEATRFRGWVCDTLKPFAAELRMGGPALMKAIGASKKKKKNDKLPRWNTEPPAPTPAARSPGASLRRHRPRRAHPPYRAPSRSSRPG